MAISTPTLGLFFAVYGEAEPTEDGTRVYARVIPAMLAAMDPTPPDMSILFVGPKISGLCVLGVEQHTEPPGVEVTRIDYDPNPEPPGVWRKRVSGRWPAQWVPVQRKDHWERLSDDDPFGV